MRHSAYAKIRHIGIVVSVRSASDQYRREERRFAEEHVNVVLEYSLESVAYSSRSSAYAARHIHDHRMIAVDRYALLLKLLHHPAGGYSISEEERYRVLVIDEIAHRVHVRKAPSLSNSLRVVVLVFDDIDTLAPQHVLFPLLCVSRHVDLDFESEECAHDAYRQPEIPGRSNLHGIPAEEFLHVIIGKTRVVIVLSDHALRKSQVFGVLENFVDAASRFDRSCDRKMAVHLEKEPARDVRAALLLKSSLHVCDILKR